MNSSSANSFHSETLPNRMTPIQSKSPSTLKLGDPISEKFTSRIDTSSVSNDSGKPNYILYAIIIVLLSILGINVFAYLGMMSDSLIGFFRPILAEVAYLGSETAKSTINTSAEGSKLGIDVAAGTLTSAIDLGQKAVSGSDDELEESVIDDHKLKQTINNSKIKKYQQQNEHNSQQNEHNSQQKPGLSDSVIPDNVDSLTQQSKPAKKAGFCYIGEDRGFRSCIKVSEQDTCMSGNIFPSQDICINPNLREGTED